MRQSIRARAPRRDDVHDRARPPRPPSPKWHFSSSLQAPIVTKEAPVAPPKTTIDTKPSARSCRQCRQDVDYGADSDASASSVTDNDSDLSDAGDCEDESDWADDEQARKIAKARPKLTEADINVTAPDGRSLHLHRQERKVPSRRLRHLCAHPLAPVAERRTTLTTTLGRRASALPTLQPARLLVTL